MIPRKIHYCWFGRNPLPKLAKKCIKSWKKYCPDYEIIEWNEDNYDISAAPLYVRQAYEAKKWAFVTDYVRLQVVYEHGGIYLDTDVELIKSPNSLLCHQAYFGFEDGVHVATGLGFGAVGGHPILAEMMNDYKDIPFVKSDGCFDQETCPSRNTKVLLKYGLEQNDNKQILDGDILILPSIYLCPLTYGTMERRYSLKTFSIHWFDASWKSADQKKAEKKKATDWLNKKRKIKLKNAIHIFLHMPHRILRTLLGESRYEHFKKFIKK